jgi:hypothetical protein
MHLEEAFKTILVLFKTITGKADGDVSLTYKGTSYGVTKPWIARIDSYECAHEDHDGAVFGLLDQFRQELSRKITAAQKEAKRLEQIYNKLGD